VTAPRVLLVDLPFASAGHPSLGLGSLQATLREAGVACDVLYANVAFAREIGVAGYERIALELPHPLLAGEWAFAGCLYRGDVRPADDYVADVLRGRWKLPADDVELVIHARDAATGFLDRLMESIDWGSYDLVGFSSSTTQNLASLALARRVKDLHPGVLVVFGGSNWDEGMGAELHRRFDFVDVAVSGEAEESLPALVRWLRRRSGADLRQIPGICYRSAGRTLRTRPARPVADLEPLPLPDYDDYFEALRDSGLTRRIRPAVHAETCRGCWWAARHACRFCGAPGCRRAYRAKSPAKVLAELRRLAARPACRMVTIVDDVPSPEFFDRVLPQLAADPLGVPIFCEVRPEVTHAHIRLLAAARASIQPGIESLSDHVLRHMRKGSRALENIRLLRWCREDGVTPSWNFMYGVPGEIPKDYQKMLDLLPAIRFLQPPDACGPVRLDRFSDYASRPAAVGWQNVRPLQAYRYLYPFPEASLRRIAYAFEYDWAPGRDPSPYVAPVRSAVEAWQREPEQGELRLDADDGGLMIVDRRRGTRRVRRLDDVEGAVYGACADIRSRDELGALLAGRFPEEARLPDKIDAALAAFVAECLAVKDGDRYLSLALGDAD
jgi:ribosomal peptide maturation radical SAM protein 1